MAKKYYATVKYTEINLLKIWLIFTYIYTFLKCNFKPKCN